ncbi:HD domain-containing protein [Terrisporobacter petrolearius]|uniref:HD domain-containing protein n=1 Tax=Terrisporobacter petrolearius TaxID=1460447 RepID=UPI001D15F633|nr:HD domain-containing protein [Terrisporobacter petrolearius]MCC3863203.1 HD domain-containing protein [Terrisporobacter petrolearius]
MDKDVILKETKSFVKNKLYKEGSGHDWFHIKRVYNLATYICENEGGDEFIIKMTSLLHDIDDWKFSNNNKTTESFLKSISVDEESIYKIMNIITTMSYKGGVINSYQNNLEGKIVQDADRLDAMGAIGIARAFTYGGSKNKLMYDPHIKPKNFQNLDEVKNLDNHTINHFYEKLLKLKDLINTDTAKQIAEERHRFMEIYLDEFYYEWNFNKEK